MSVTYQQTPVAPQPAVSDQQLIDAWLAAREELLAERNPQGYWIGKLSSSPLATATAISALTVAERHSTQLSCLQRDQADQEASERWNIAYRTDLSELICQSVRWLAQQQNEDGGWGDTDRSGSNLATTMLVLSAFRMTGVPGKYADLEPRAERYIRAQGGVAGLKKRYGRDKSFVTPVLANCALAGVVPWSRVSALPFERTLAPPSWRRWLHLPVVSHALPALVAVGLAKHHHKPSANPLSRWLRSMVTEKCLALISKMQPDSGGFLEATPLTSFVVMALASTGRSDHAIVRRGVEFLLASVRSDGSWSQGADLAVRNTTHAVNALEQGEDTTASATPGAAPSPQPVTPLTIDWLLACQQTETHPFTAADAGGWGWTNLSGGIPNAHDTAAALLALHGSWQGAKATQQARIAQAVSGGVRWLLDLQNRDGGWPTFTRGWGNLASDRSGCDLTAGALRALHTWRNTRGWWTASAAHPQHSAALASANLDRRIDAAIAAGLQFLRDQQTEEGSWIPLWFGNERRPGERNPIFGTACVLQALAEVEGTTGESGGSSSTRAGLEWLVRQQHKEGAWGADPKAKLPLPSVEETAVAVESLLPWIAQHPPAARAVDRGVKWLAEAVTRGLLDEASPVGLSFAKHWYYERLYPKSFAVSALGAAVRRRVALGEPTSKDMLAGGGANVASATTGHARS